MSSRAFEFRVSRIVVKAALGTVLWAVPLASSAQGTGRTDLLDLLLVVDNSGSMTARVAVIEAAINDPLMAQLRLRGFEVRVILLSADSSDPEGACFSAPLGSGACPGDENLPDYRHIVATIGSTDALQQILTLYPQYSASLRAGSHRSIIVFTDDESQLSASSFTVQLLALDPDFTPFTFHAAASAQDFDPTTCPNGAVQGAQYLALVASRGGYFHDYCVTNELAQAFAEIARTIGIFVDGFESGLTGDWSAAVP